MKKFFFTLMIALLVASVHANDQSFKLINNEVISESINNLVKCSPQVNVISGNNGLVLYMS